MTSLSESPGVLVRVVMFGFWLAATTSSMATAHAATIPVSCVSDLQTVINSAVAGDTLVLGACTFTANFGSFILSKNLTIRGDGTGVAILDGNLTNTVLTVGSGVVATVDRITVRNGTSQTSGGGIVNHGTLTITNSVLSDNASTSNGGAVFSDGTLLTIVGSTFMDNSASGVGGAVFFTSAVSVTNSTFNANTAVDGAALAALSNVATLVMSDSTVAGNPASNPAGAALLYPPSTTVSGSIVAANTAIDCRSNNVPALPLTASGDNLETGTSCGFGRSGNPQLLPLADNGGPTPTIKPIGPETIGQRVCVGNDQRGAPRPGIGKVACDIGAYETGAPKLIVVSPSSGTLDFGTVTAGDFVNLAFVLANGGNDPLVFSGMPTTSDPAHFAVIGFAPANVPATGSIDGFVRYTPTANGTDQGSLTIVSNDPSSPSMIALAGQGAGFVPPPGPGLNHFLCYQISRGAIRQTVSLASEFGSTSAVVRRAQRLCAPANKEGENPNAPFDVDHLTGYSLATSFTERRDQVVVNQFGTLTVDLVRAASLLVPTAKSTTEPPGVYEPAISHFECFRAVHARFRRPDIDVIDQFGTRVVNVRRPTGLCIPVAKDGSTIADPSASLMCYRVSGRPRLNNAHVFTTNQFGDDEYDVGAVRELCVPSLLNPGGPTATPVATRTPTATATPAATDEPTATSTPAPTATATPVPSATVTPTGTPEPTATATPGCGNASLDAGEDCDDGNAIACDGCSPTCRFEGCGDGTTCGAETCDDGNTTDCDGCSSTCTVESCGDGTVCSPEECDPPGASCSNGRTCTAECTCPIPTCGDGFIDAPVETCDDGNTTNCDGCSSTCQTEPSCDDGVPCTDDSCNPFDGACVNTPNDGFCDDGDEGTTDRCLVPCNVGYCTPETGCQNEPGGGCGCS